MVAIFSNCHLFLLFTNFCTTCFAELVCEWRVKTCLEARSHFIFLSFSIPVLIAPTICLFFLKACSDHLTCTIWDHSLLLRILHSWLPLVYWISTHGVETALLIKRHDFPPTMFPETKWYVREILMVSRTLSFLKPSVDLVIYYFITYVKYIGFGIA